VAFVVTLTIRAKILMEDLAVKKGFPAATFLMEDLTVKTSLGPPLSSPRVTMEMATKRIYSVMKKPSSIISIVDL
jgi:hypothetical protein